MGETGCILGAGEGSNGWKWMKLDEKTHCLNQREHRNHTTHRKRKRQKHSVSAGFWQGQKDLNPRHAVLEWMWGHGSGSEEGTVLSSSCRKSQNGRCWFGAAGKFWRSKQEKASGKFRRKPPLNVRKSKRRWAHNILKMNSDNCRRKC